MAIPSVITDLSTTAASNSPQGNEQVFPSLDDFIRAYGAFIAQLNANKAPIASPTFTGTVTLPGDAASALQAVTKQQFDTGLALKAPIASPTFTGTVTLPGNAASALVAVPKQQLDASIETVASSLGSFSNLRASTTGTNATVSVTADELVLKSTSNTYKTVRAVSLSINSAASGANGLDTGAVAANTWYSIWVIWNGTTVAGLLSTSETSPTMPGGYTHKARVGWIRTDGTANKYPLGFVQSGKRVQWRVASGSNVTAWPTMASPMAWGAVSVSNFSPPSASSVRVMITSGGDSANSSVGPSSATSSTMSYLVCGNGANYFAGSAQVDINLESSNIYFSSNSSPLSSIGWDDNL